MRSAQQSDTAGGGFQSDGRGSLGELAERRLGLRACARAAAVRGAANGRFGDELG